MCRKWPIYILKVLSKNLKYLPLPFYRQLKFPLIIILEVEEIEDRVAWLWHYTHYLSIPLYTNSWSEPFSRHTLYLNYSFYLSTNERQRKCFTDLKVVETRILLKFDHPHTSSDLSLQLKQKQSIQNVQFLQKVILYMYKVNSTLSCLLSWRFQQTKHPSKRIPASVIHV